MRKYIQIEKLFLIISLIFISVANFSAYSQDTYRVFFKDKGEKLKSENEQKNDILQILNQRCLQRRAKVLSLNSLYTIEDAPVFKPYLQELSKTGAEILVQLRWKNYCVVRADNNAIENIKKLDFVKSTQPTGSKLESSADEIIEIKGKTILSKISIDTSITDTKFYYGNAFRQIEMLGINKLQELGFTGDGVLIGFIDSGFRWRQHKSLKNAKVIGEYDFVNQDTLTYNDDSDQPNQDHHGTLVFSTVAGFSNGKLIGTAPNAEFLLAKTENMKFEKRIEEDFFAAGIEWMESQGVDVVNASLGYRNFDSTCISYKNEDFDGSTTICAQAVNSAYSKGMVFISAAGNNGGDSLTLITPADAYGTFAVGSVDSNGIDVSKFSSKGPNSIGMIKPEFVSFGNRPVCASPSDSASFTKAKGTSIASPLLAGSVGLIVSIYPQITPIEIKNLLKKVSSNKLNPNNKLGWGVPNFYEAVKNYGIAISPTISYRLNNKQRIVVNFLSKDKSLKNKLFIKFYSKQNFTEFEMLPACREYQYYTDIPLENFNDKPGYAYILSESETYESRLPFQTDSLIIINPYKTIIPPGIDTENLPGTLFSASSSYFYSSIVNKDVSNLKLNIFLRKAGNFELKIFDYLGNNVENYSKNSEIEGYNLLDLNISKLAPGAYFVLIIQPDGKEILKFLKIN